MVQGGENNSRRGSCPPSPILPAPMMQTEQLLCWNGMTDTEHSTTSDSNEDEGLYRYS